MRTLNFFITGFVPALLVAQSGSLDPAFGNGGVFISDDLDQVGNATLQPDGKILVAGSRSYDIGVARYDPNGALDEGFGENGVATKDIPEGSVVGVEVAVQSDGKILVVGRITNSPTRIVLVRFGSSGDLDPSFGSGGEVITSVGGSCYAYGLAVHADGSIVVVGSAVATGGSYSDIAVVSYLPDGTLDATFSGDGKVITPFSSYTDIAYDVAIDANDRILVTGYGGSTSMDLFLARYLPDGTLDNAFAGGGIAGTAMPGTEEVGSSIAIRPDGRVLIGGTSYTDPDSSKFILFGFLENGAWDPDFGSNGVVYTDIAAGTGHCTSILLQPDGRIVAGGWCGVYQSRDFALARYGVDGSLDSDFGSNGIVVTDLTSPNDIGSSLMLQSSGRIILSGSQSDVEMAAYLSGLIIGVAI